MFVSSAFRSERHPATRVSVNASQLGGTWSCLLGVDTSGTSVSVYLDPADIEALAAACATILRKMSAPTLVEEAA